MQALANTKQLAKSCFFGKDFPTGGNLAEVDRDGGLNLRKWSYTYGSELPPEMGLNLRK